jgi:hypothetical protein
VRDVAHRGERRAHLRAGVRERRAVLAARPCARRLERDCERREALLGAVMEIALEPPALGISRCHDPGARRAQVLQPGPELGM